MKMLARSTHREPLCKEVNQVNPERNYMEMLARSTHMESLCEDVGHVNP